MLPWLSLHSPHYLLLLLLLSCCAGIRVIPNHKSRWPVWLWPADQCPLLCRKLWIHWSRVTTGLRDSRRSEETREKKKNMRNMTSGTASREVLLSNIKVSSTVRQILEATRKQWEIKYWSWILNTWTHRSYHSNWCRNFSGGTFFNGNIVGPIISWHPQHYLAIYILYTYNLPSCNFTNWQLVPTKYLKNMVLNFA